MREMEDLTVDDLTTARVLVLERDLDRIRVLRNEYQDGIEDFLEEFQHLVEDENVLLRWRGEVPAIGREVKEHANRLRTKMEYLNPTSRFSEMEKSGNSREGSQGSGAKFSGAAKAQCCQGE